jgi:oligopeptide/dipeptide ABC transporter ATP-binding protein
VKANSPLLKVEHLTTRFFTQRGEVGAVEDVSLIVNEGEAIGIVGESGSGKSVTALSVLGLVPLPGEVVAGHVLFRGTDLLKLSPQEMRLVRREDIAIIFQDASNFLNPVMAIGDQIAEGLPPEEPNKRQKVIDALRAVHIPEPTRVVDYYPFQMSGGMQQRAVIAAAVVRRPAIIIADEPTTALDATVQYQILRLLDELQSTINTALVLISHDLAVVASVCRRVYIMYAAQIVESGNTDQIYSAPAHPYTQSLLDSILDPLEERAELKALPGTIPDLAAPPAGCRFHPRCPARMDICSRREPPTFEVSFGHTAKCWLHGSRPGAVP